MRDSRERDVEGDLEARCLGSFERELSRLVGQPRCRCADVKATVPGSMSSESVTGKRIVDAPAARVREDAVTPGARPSATNVIAPANPPPRATVMVTFAEEPCSAVVADSSAVKLNEGDSVTVVDSGEQAAVSAQTARPAQVRRVSMHRGEGSIQSGPEQVARHRAFALFG